MATADQAMQRRDHGHELARQRKLNRALASPMAQRRNQHLMI
ncbi:hypothetical protein SynMITS9220_02418 [Synechococcus sp. MIT S9220]|nr:hypothetical protein SynMITS9220_02418 [Synechococcus sp. MIT S9220]